MRKGGLSFVIASPTPSDVAIQLTGLLRREAPRNDKQRQGNRGANARGFTLVELMVVVTIVGLLAALALPAFERVKRAAIGRRYFNDVRQIRDGAERYALERGNYPPNGIGALHPDLRGYVPDKLFDATTPLGGTWDWDYQQSGFTASVSVYMFTVSDTDLRAIDRAFDDGDLNAGTLRKDGSKFIYVIVP